MRALAMASAFGTVRPAHEQPAPIVIEQPQQAATAPTGMQPEQLIQMVTGIGQMLANAWKAGVTNAAGAGS